MAFVASTMPARSSAAAMATAWTPNCRMPSKKSDSAAGSPRASSAAMRCMPASGTARSGSSAIAGGQPSAMTPTTNSPAPKTTFAPMKRHVLKAKSDAASRTAAVMPGLPLDPGSCDSLDEVALEEHVQDEDRDRGNDDRRHQRRPVVRHAAGQSEQREPDRQGPVVAVADEHNRPEERVPRALELEDRDRGDRGRREGQHDPEERREVAGAIDARRLLEVLRDREEVLAEQEHAGRGDREHQGDARVLEHAA